MVPCLAFLVTMLALFLFGYYARDLDCLLSQIPWYPVDPVACSDRPQSDCMDPYS